MSREQFIKDKIKQRGYNIKEFAKEINMPYSTLLSMLNGSIGGAAVDNVIKVCNGLGITVCDLEDEYKNATEIRTLANTFLWVNHAFPQAYIAGIIFFGEFSPFPKKYLKCVL